MLSVSIWGKRVDGWFDQKTNRAGLGAGDRERNAWRLVAALALLVVVAAAATYGR
jgi:hypothetical protein